MQCLFIAGTQGVSVVHSALFNSLRPCLVFVYVQKIFILKAHFVCIVNNDLL